MRRCGDPGTSSLFFRHAETYIVICIDSKQLTILYHRVVVEVLNVSCGQFEDCMALVSVQATRPVFALARLVRSVESAT